MINRRLLIVMILMFALHSGAGGEDTLRYGLLVTVLQDPLPLGSRTEIERLVRFAGENRIDTIFMQVYRANMSYHMRGSGDSSAYRACAGNVGEDPLGLLIKESHAAGIKVYAWLNVLSLSGNREAALLKKFGPGILTCGLSAKRSVEDYRTDGQYFLEPGDLCVRQELVEMTGCLVEAYPDIDGLLFDYIRYPDKDPPYGYTKANIERYVKECGRASVDEDDAVWKDWKRRQVTETLEALAKKARSVKSGINITATACAPYTRAREEAFQDWPGWISGGLVDSVMLMSYPADLGSLKRYVSEAKERAPDFDKVDIAVPAYKLVDSPEIFSQQLEFCRSSKPRMCVIFHYESLLKNRALVDSLARADR